MIPLYEDPHFAFRFADGRIIHRFPLGGHRGGTASIGHLLIFAQQKTSYANINGTLA